MEMFQIIFLSVKKNGKHYNWYTFSGQNQKEYKREIFLLFLRNFQTQIDSYDLIFWLDFLVFPIIVNIPVFEYVKSKIYYLV